jgi:hypothetical protein
MCLGLKESLRGYTVDAEWTWTENSVEYGKELEIEPVMVRAKSAPALWAPVNSPLLALRP